jgi:hypothetical protein
MKPNPIQPTNQLTFQYSHPLKTAFDRGLMPEVKRGLLGHKLTKKNRSIEHIIPKCMGGTLANDNVALSDRKANMLRGATPIEKVVTKEMWINYLRQFINVKNKFVDGMEYIKGICKKFSIDIKEVLNV